MQSANTDTLPEHDLDLKTDFFATIVKPHENDARVLNISHGEFIMLGGMTTWTLYTALGINPLISLAVCGPVAFILGFIIHRTLFKRLLATSASAGIFESKSMLASFGLLFIIQNIASIVWETDLRGYSYLATPVNLVGTVFGLNRLVTLGCAVVIGVAFYLYITYTRLGKAIRAAAQDPATAGLMGVNINNVLALCFGFGNRVVGQDEVHEVVEQNIGLEAETAIP